MPGAVAAAAALAVVGVGGDAAIEHAVLERSRLVYEAVRRLDAEILAPWRSERERAGIVTFRIQGRASAAVVDALAAEGFVVSERGGWVRVAPHATTPLAAIDAFGSTLAAQVR